MKNFSRLSLILLSGKSTKIALQATLISCMLLVLAACGGSAGSKDAPTLTHASSNVYLIGESDVISVDVWKNPEISVSATVRPDGMITMPLIGDIRASEKTTEQLADDIVVALSDYVRTPQVTVIVDNPVSADFRNRVRVTGAVNNPTSIPYREGMTVLDVVLSAGGLSEFAAPNKALLYRKNEQGVVTAYSILLKDIFDRGKLKTNYPLQPADIIAVPERNF